MWVCLCDIKRYNTSGLYSAPSNKPMLTASLLARRGPFQG